MTRRRGAEPRSARHRCGSWSRGDSEGGTTAEPGDRPAQHRAVPHGAVDPARRWPATRTRPATTPSTGCSSGTSRNCGRWASRCRPTTEDGYRIPQVEFSLPELNFTPAETAALGLAARLWSTTTLDAAGAGACARSGTLPNPGRQRRDEAADAAGRTATTAAAAGAHRRTRPSGRCARRSRPVARCGSPTARSASATREHAGTCSRGAWCPSAAGGTWSGSTWTAAPDAPSGSPGSPAVCGDRPRPAPCTVPATSTCWRPSGQRRPPAPRGTATMRIAPGARRRRCDAGRRQVRPSDGDSRSTS